jgi:two-component system nitrate/nitrite response regulator NarL
MEESEMNSDDPSDPRQLDARAAVIISQIRFLSECLIEALLPDTRTQILGTYSELSPALDAIVKLKPEFVILDATFPSAPPSVVHICAVAPWVRVIVLAVNETEDNVIGWVKAGAAGYIPNSTPLSNLADLLADIAEGRQACSTHIVGGLLRRIAHLAPEAPGFASGPSLTEREREILRLIGAGLSNKDIARRLSISLATTKAHVHNVLGKLNVRRRGEATAWVNGRGDVGAYTKPASPARSANEYDLSRTSVD